MILNQQKKTGLRKLKLPKSRVLMKPLYAARDKAGAIVLFFCGDHPIKSCKCVLAELSVEKYSLHSDKTNRIATFSFCIVVNILGIRVFFNNFLKTISCALTLLQFTMPSVYSIVDQTWSFPFFSQGRIFSSLEYDLPRVEGSLAYPRRAPLAGRENFSYISLQNFAEPFYLRC